MLQNAAKSLATASRQPGGFMPAGGIDPMSSARKQVLDTAAGQYRGDYTQSMDYLYKNAEFDARARDALANLLGTQMNVGSGLNKQVLEAIGLDAAGLADWQKSAGAAYGDDVNAANSAMMSETGRVRENRQATQAESARNAAAMQRQNDEGLLKQLLSGNPVLPYSTPVSAQLLNYLRNKGLYGDKPPETASGAPIQNYARASGGQGQISGSGAGGTINTWKPIPYS